jgi:dephospho-CoA kinase
MKVIAIIGEPGSGKSTLMRKLMAKIGIENSPIDTSFKLVPYHNKDNVYVLGKYEEGVLFAGTDKMSMAVQPEAIKFLDSIPADSTVIFEGDRLGTASFLENCNDKYDLTIIYLKTDRQNRMERCKDRGSEQNETWLAGRESKISNILGNMELKFVTEIMSNNTYEDQENVVEFVHNMV